MNLVSQISALCDRIMDCPLEATPRLMLADLCEENELPSSAAMLRSGNCFLACYGYGGYGAGDGDGDGGGGDGDGGYGDGGYGGGGYGGGGDGYGDGDGDGGYDITFSRGFSMIQDELCIICSPGGYYPYVRIGWARRADGFIELHNCRVIKNFGTNAELAWIAKNGPKDSTKLLTASPLEHVSVCCVSRHIPADAEAWKLHVPKPKGF